MRLWTLCGVVGVGCCGLARAQEGEKPLLSGPEVRDTRPALVEGGFGGQKVGKARLGAMEAIQPRDLREIMGAMASDPALRLTGAQAGRVRELMDGYERDRRAYVIRHRRELAELRRAAGARPDPTLTRARPGERAEARNLAAPEAGRAPGSMGDGTPPLPERSLAPRGAAEKPTDGQEAAGRRLRELMRAGPSAGDLQRRIYAELTSEQRRFVDAEMLRRGEERARLRNRTVLEDRRRTDPAGQTPGARPWPESEAGRAERGQRRRSGE